MDLLRSNREKKQFREVINKLSRLQIPNIDRKALISLEKAINLANQRGKISDAGFELVMSRIKELEIGIEEMSSGKIVRFMDEIVRAVNDTPIAPLTENKIKIEELDFRAKQLKTQLEELRTEGNQLIRRYHVLNSEGRKDDVEEIKLKVQVIKNKIDASEKARKRIYKEFEVANIQEDISIYSDIAGVISKYQKTDFDGIIREEVNFDNEAKEVEDGLNTILGLRKNSRQTTETTLPYLDEENEEDVTIPKSF